MKINLARIMDTTKKKFEEVLKWHRRMIGCLTCLTVILLPTSAFSQLTGSVNITNATCPESTDGSITVLVEGGQAPYAFDWSNGASMTSGETIDGFTFMGYFEDHAYYRSNSQALNLASAQAEAVGNRGYIASINSQEENDWIFANGAQAGDFIGGTDAEQEGSYRWASGEPFSFTNWGGAEPNNSGDEDFIQFRTDGQWNDSDWLTSSGISYIIEVPISNQIENLSAGAYTITVTDDNGLSEERTFNIGPDPIDISFDLEPTSSCNTEVNDGIATATVSGGSAPYSFEWGSGESNSEISNLTAGTYALTVTDNNGCTTEGVAEIEVEDETAPIAAVKSATIYLNEQGVATVSVEDIDNGSFDDCGIADIFVQNPNFECSEDPFGPGMTAELVVIDEAGNEATALADIAIADTIKPTFDLESIEIPLSEEGVGILTQEMLAPFANDNCQINEIAIQQNEFACDLAPAALTTEIIVFDIYGNFQQKTLSIVLIDDVLPTVSVEDFILELDANGVAILDEQTADITIIDNCFASDITFSASEFDCSHLGENAEAVLVTDFAGNEGSAEFTVTVVDNIAPEISGPQILSICEGVPLDFSQITATDNCSVELIQTSGPEEGESPVAGEYPIQFEATDLSSNSTSFSAILTVQPGALVDLGEDMEVDEGTLVTLVAGDDENNDYLWSNGSTGESYQFVATEDVIVSVVVTSANGCESSDEIDITISSPLSATNESAQHSANFYPNPAQDQLTIDLNTKQTMNSIRVNVLDISGKVVIQKIASLTGNDSQINLDLTELSKGVYIVNLQSDFMSISERIIKN